MLADRRRGIRDSQLGILGAAWPKKTSETEWTRESPGVTQAGINQDFKTLFFEVEKLQQSLGFRWVFWDVFWLIFWLEGCKGLGQRTWKTDAILGVKPSTADKKLEACEVVGDFWERAKRFGKSLDLDMTTVVSYWRTLESAMGQSCLFHVILHKETGLHHFVRVNWHLQSPTISNWKEVSYKSNPSQRVEGMHQKHPPSARSGFWRSVASVCREIMMNNPFLMYLFFWEERCVELVQVAFTWSLPRNRDPLHLTLSKEDHQFKNLWLDVCLVNRSSWFSLIVS